MQIWEDATHRDYVWGGLQKPADAAMWGMTLVNEAAEAIPELVSMAVLLDIKECYEQVQHKALTATLLETGLPHGTCGAGDALVHPAQEAGGRQAWNSGIRGARHERGRVRVCDQDVQGDGHMRGGPSPETVPIW